MERATLKDAPAFLNINDGAMWVLGFNEALERLASVADGPTPACDPQPFCIEGLAWAVAYGDNCEIAASFDTSKQAHAFVNFLKRFIEPKRA